MSDMKGRKKSEGSEELKPCPFCGKTSELIVTSSYNDDDDYSNDDSYTIVCDASTDNQERGCGASCGFKATKSLAIKEWNMRVNLIKA